VLFGLLALAIDDTRNVAFARIAADGIFALIVPLAALVIGDAVLGGAFVAALVRPDGEAPSPARVVTATTVPQPAAAPGPVADAGSFVDTGAVAPAPSAPASSTTAPPTTSPATTRPAPVSGPSVAQVPSTTVPVTTPPSTTSLPAQPPPSTDVVG
jgi:hypothetical protein